MLFPDDASLRRMRNILFRWYDPAARPLPWRKTSDPYAVWVSEIMLQQTTTQTVTGYFERFLERFPDVRALARADINEVLRFWEGLGYYRRARMLHDAAKIILDDFGGRFPSDPKQVMSLPGIGRYTAGAVLSIAFDAREPILEANTIRLHARLLGLETCVTGKEERKLLWTMAEKILPSSRCGLFNQILMDFGAFVCVSGCPACPQCPLRPYCRAAQLGKENSIPHLGKPTVKEERTEIALLVRPDGGRSRKTKEPSPYLFLRYPSGGRWSGLWDFPRFLKTNTLPIHQDESLAQAACTLLACSSVETGLPVYSMRHAVTRYRIALHFCEAFPVGSNQNASPLSATNVELAAGRFPLEQIQTRFLTLKESETVPLNSTARKFVDLMLARTE